MIMGGADETKTMFVLQFDVRVDLFVRKALFAQLEADAHRAEALVEPLGNVNLDQARLAE